MGCRAETALEALQVALEANPTGINYRPDTVQPRIVWPEPGGLDRSLRTVYLFRPDRVRSGPGPTSCEVDETLEVYILAARKREQASEQDEREELGSERWRVAVRLVADVGLKLRADEKLALATGSPAVITALRGSAGQQVQGFLERWLAEWVVVELATSIHYRYPKGEL